MVDDPTLDARPPGQLPIDGAGAARLILAPVGLCLGVLQVEGYVYEVMNHLAVPADSRPWALGLVLAAHLAWWWAATSYGRLSLAELATAIAPLGVLCLGAITVVLDISLGSWGLYGLLGLVGWTAARVARRWQGEWLPGLSPRAAWLIAGGLCLLFIAWTAWYQRTRYEQMVFGYSDVGYYVKRLQNTFRYGAFLRHHAELPTFWDHLCPGLAILLPVALVLSPLNTLILAQSAFWGGTGLLLMGLARRRGLAPGLALAVAVCWYLYPGVSQMTYCYSYGFHPPTLALPFLVLAAWWLDARRYPLAIAASIAVLAMQEHFGIYFAGLGVMLFLGGERRAGIVCAATGTAIFLFIFKIFMPWHVGGENVHVGQLFGHLGEGLGGIALSPVLRPAAFWGNLADPHNLHLLLQLALPLAGAMLLAPRFLVALGPIFLFNFLRPDLQAKSVAFHYQTGTIGLLFLAVVLGLTAGDRPEARWYGLRRPLEWLGRCPPRAWLAGALAAAAVASLYLALLPWSKQNLGIVPEPDQLARNAVVFRELQALIPPEATVTGDERTRMLFTDRRLDLDFKQAPYHPTDYHVYQAGAWHTDPSDTWRRVENLLATGEWEAIYRQHDTIVLRRRTPLPPLPGSVY